MARKGMKGGGGKSRVWMGLRDLMVDDGLGF